MFAYLCSVSVSALEANAIGFPSCRRTAPRHLFDSSTCWLVSFDAGEGYFFENQVFDLLQCFLVTGSPLVFRFFLQ